MKDKKITIKDVAKEAGVSVATASRALGEYGYVTKETKEKVLNAALKLNYNYNALAKSLRTNKTMTIGYLLPDIANPFYSRIVRGIQDVAFEEGYNVIICSNDNDIIKTERFVKMFLRHQVEGIIYSTPYNQVLNDMCETFKKQGIPIINCYGSTQVCASDMVIGDAEKGCYQATHHLLELGHRQIAILRVKESGISKRRFEGCKKALEDFGIEIDPHFLVDAEDFSQKSGYLQAKILFSYPQKPTAILAFSEQLAIGVLKAAREDGIKVPEDLSLVGVDDIIAEVLEPPLTSVALPTYEAGRTAASLLFSRLRDGNSSPSRQVVLEEKLVVRKSTKGRG